MKKGAIPTIVTIVTLTILFYFRIVDPLEFFKALLVALIIISAGLLLKSIERWGYGE